MTCIIVDDEPLAREAIEMLIQQTPDLDLVGSFNSAPAAGIFLEKNESDIIFLDIQMPGINGLEFARNIPKNTFLIFTTAHSEFAIDSYEVDAIDYLIKPVRLERFQKAVEKVHLYSKLFKTEINNTNIETFTDDYFFVKADRKIYKLSFTDILFIEGLKDYVVMHTENQKIITAMNVKTIYEKLPKQMFVRVSKSYIININKINAVDNNNVYMGKYEIAIGNAYRDTFFNDFIVKKIFTSKS